ncbi:PfkB family carbohydrate kinase, partial [Microbacterium sp.]|uniref:PfkB family carbohydrate kinase n=1 Tax=Microbacterium sp. TaxID=51671 RepID=UPI003C7522E4
ARAGAPTLLVAAVGTDAEGAEQVEELRRVGVDVSEIVVVPGPTGMAFIAVTPEGENAITVVPGANGALTAAHAVEVLGRTDPGVVVLQTEVSAAVISAVAAWCTAARTRLILNDGPTIPLPASTLAAADPIVVNQHEARSIIGAASESTLPAGLAREVQRATGARSVVVTMGADGSEVAEPGGVYSVPAVLADEVVDTTGAGDTFLGTLASALAKGAELSAAVAAATAAAAESVGWLGARPPSR